MPSPFDLLHALFGFLALATWVSKYYLHFTYRKTWDQQLHGVDFFDFLFSMGRFTNLKLAFCAPWIWRNSAAELQIPGMKQKGILIFLLCLAMGLIFISIGIISEAEKAGEITDPG
ncbi:MAG: hypothetical protein ACJ77K_14480 [Bacteroidia bacterium]